LVTKGEKKLFLGGRDSQGVNFQGIIDSNVFYFGTQRFLRVIQLGFKGSLFTFKKFLSTQRRISHFALPLLGGFRNPNSPPYLGRKEFSRGGLTAFRAQFLLSLWGFFFPKGGS